MDYSNPAVEADDNIPTIGEPQETLPCEEGMRHEWEPVDDSWRSDCGLAWGGARKFRCKHCRTPIEVGGVKASKAAVRKAPTPRDYKAWAKASKGQAFPATFFDGTAMPGRDAGNIAPSFSERRYDIRARREREDERARRRSA